MRHSAALLSFPVFVLLATSSFAADRPSFEVRSGNFTVVTDADENSGRRIAWQFEQMRSALQTMWPWAHLDLDKPVLVLAAKDEASMKALAPAFWEKNGRDDRPTSVAITGVDRHYIALRSDIMSDDRSGTINPYWQAYWTYATTVIQVSVGRKFPLWLSRGLSEVLSNTIVRDSYVEIGRPFPWHLQTVRNGVRLSLRELAAVDRSSPWETDMSRRPSLDASSWAFVHFLLFSEQGAHQPQLDRFMSSVAAGQSSAVAFQLAFGDPDVMERAFKVYFSSPLIPYSKLGGDQKVRKEGFAIRSLSPAESAATRAAFHATMGRPLEARALVDAARKATPIPAAAYDAEGLLMEFAQKPDDARLAFGKAIELGSTSFYTYFRWAARTWPATTDASSEKIVEQALERSIALHATFPPAHALLGEVKARLGKREDGLAEATRAATLDPGDVRNRLALARVLWTLTRRDEAQREARSAMALATTDADRGAVQELISFFEKNSTAPSR
jgi:tetratricopeptide (TPR) repeat protein